MNARLIFEQDYRTARELGRQYADSGIDVCDLETVGSFCLIERQTNHVRPLSERLMLFKLMREFNLTWPAMSRELPY